MQQHLERARELFERRGQRAQLRKAYRVVQGMKLLDALQEIARVRDALERGRAPEGIRRVKGQIGGQMVCLAEQRLRVGAQQRGARTARITRDLAEATA